MSGSGWHIASYAWRSLQAVATAFRQATATQAGVRLTSSPSSWSCQPTTMMAACANSTSQATSAIVGRSTLPTLLQRLGSPTHSLAPSLGSSIPSFSFSTSSMTALPAGSSSPGGKSGGGLASEDEGDDEGPTHERAKGRATESKQQAQRAMADPLSMLMASRGMPLGISTSELGDSAIRGAHIRVENLATATEYKMEALDDIFKTTKPVPNMGEVQYDPRRHPDGNSLKEGSVDSWGTTMEGPAEIARRLAESNKGLEAMAAESEGLEDIDTESSAAEDDLKLELAPGEAKFRTLEQMSKDIKGLDEVFEVLASVPWLDENNIQEKELKGVAMFGLIGTLEEVGFNIKDQVLRIWKGERDHDIITECKEAKDQAALISILFHTKRLEEEFGKPLPFKSK